MWISITSNWIYFQWIFKQKSLCCCLKRCAHNSYWHKNFVLLYSCASCHHKARLIYWRQRQIAEQYQPSHFELFNWANHKKITGLLKYIVLQTLRCTHDLTFCVPDRPFEWMFVLFHVIIEYEKWVCLTVKEIWYTLSKVYMVRLKYILSLSAEVQIPPSICHTYFCYMHTQIFIVLQQW